MTDIHPNFICPITRHIFSDPVLASDGFTYERSAIEQWFSNKSTSPTTNEKINNVLTVNNAIKQLIDELCEKNKKLLKDRFKPDNSYVSNQSKIKDIIESGNFVELLKYNKFDAQYMHSVKLLCEIFDNCQEYKVIKHFLDNVIQSHDTIIFCVDDTSIIHEAILSSNLIAIKYIFKNDCDYMSFAYACLKSNYKIITYLINIIKTDVFEKFMFTIRSDIDDWAKLGDTCFNLIGTNANLKEYGKRNLIREIVDKLSMDFKQNSVKMSKKNNKSKKRKR